MNYGLKSYIRKELEYIVMSYEWPAAATGLLHSEDVFAADHTTYHYEQLEIQISLY